MKTIWKRFEAWVTDLRSNIFSWARISITVLYLLIIILTLIVYSGAMYFSLVHNIRDQINLTGQQFGHNHIFEEAVERVQLQIIIIDVITFLVAAAGSYWLAGVTLRPIKRALEAQEAFSADASHELRTPLAVMKTDIEVLLRGNPDMSREVVTTLQSNLEEISRLSTTTTELLEFSRGRNTLHAIIPLHDLVKKEIEGLQSLAVQKGIALSFESSLPLQVKGDSHTLSRLFKNIIANALTHTSTGGTVTVTLREKESHAAVIITDTGTGIPAEDIPHIFKRFYKVHSSRATAGSGLGLAIAKQITDQHHGSITLESQLGVGTTVTILLPSSNLH